MNYRLALLTLGTILVGTSFLVAGETYDLQLYDTYFVTGWTGILRVVGLLGCLVGGSYFLFNRKGVRNQR